MAKHQLSKANQKLYFVSILLDAIKQAEADEKLMNKKAIVQANMEACLFHLVSAYRGFVWEICNTYDVKVDASMSVSDIQQAAAEEGKQIQELNHFMSLESAQDSWLSELLRAYEKTESLDPALTSKVESPASLNAIEVRKVEESETPEKIFQWHNILKSEIESFRPTLSEW